MTIPYILKLPRKLHKAPRKIVVVDGQAYYESSGRNSGCPLIWFPFIMIKSHRPINKSKIPIIYNSLFYNEKKSAGYIIKVLRRYLKEEVDTVPDDGDDLILKSRNPLKSTVITAARLTGIFFPEATLIKAKLNPEEMRLARTPLLLEEHPVFCSTEPEKINDWLIRQGVSMLSELFDKPEHGTIRQSDACVEYHSRLASSQGQKTFKGKSRFKPY